MYLYRDTFIGFAVLSLGPWSYVMWLKIYIQEVLLYFEQLSESSLKCPLHKFVVGSRVLFMLCDGLLSVELCLFICSLVCQYYFE